ncbi:MAG: hypothetical protein ACTHU0_21295 [Kofleriaceae bacterium]
MEGLTYAQAMGFATILLTWRRAHEQGFVSTVYDNLTIREREYGVTPPASDTIPERRQVLRAMRRLPNGGTRSNVEQALSDLLGDDFLGFLPVPMEAAALWPAAIGDQPMNLQRSTIARKLVTIDTSISIGLGSPQTVIYTGVRPEHPTLADAVELGDAASVLKVGDKLVVHPENNTFCEVVEVEAIDVQVTSETTFDLKITATFNNPHPAGVLATTMPFPMWSSTKRHNLVALSEDAIIDPEKVRKTHLLLRRMLTGVSTWNVVAGLGPFRVGEGKLGATPIGTIEI